MEIQYWKRTEKKKIEKSVGLIFLIESPRLTQTMKESGYYKLASPSSVKSIRKERAR
tara:strand:- start:738 stop:908 length:171 start_codon:yes stop_codon:yes gene_type:complete